MGYSDFKKLLYLIVSVDEMLVLFLFSVLHTAVSAELLLLLCLEVSVYLYTQCCRLLLTRTAVFSFKSLIHSL